MCDERTFEEDQTFLKNNHLSRRSFGAVTTAAALAACATPSEALSVSELDVTIRTPDGECDAYFAHPTSGAHAAVLVWPDAMGLRPAFRTMGKRLAESGYAVLTVNQFYRDVRAPFVESGASAFSDPDARTRIMGMMRGLTPEKVVSDAGAYLAFLDSQAVVDKGRKIGTTGYCMGGATAFRTAATSPGRVGAVASFHGGGLVNDQPASPHRLIAQTGASYLIAIAQNDDANDPNAKTVLRQTFDETRRTAEIEVYPAQHGWCPPDTQVYDPEQAERAWGRLLALFETALA
ncbi:MAG: dienelactone hydrolase family protein [Caulobacterales bacterium]